MNPPSAEELLEGARYEVPPAVPSYVERTRLNRMLRVRPTTPLVVVSAPAGSGKTTLVSAWVRSMEDTSTTVWVTLEEHDADFWGPVLSALRRLGADLPNGLGPRRSGGLLGQRGLTELAATTARWSRPVTVVVDGLELESLDLAREVDFWLRHSGGGLRLVLVGRVDPVLTLPRYRLEETLVEIRGRDLAFSDREAGRLLEAMGVRLSQPGVHRLNGRLKGWAAGLRFAARALAGSTDIERAAADVVAWDGEINEYLLGEVLQTQPPEVRRFLLRTSVPDLLHPALAAELAGPGGPRQLAELTRTETFVEAVGDESGCYRYYPFFRTMLRARLVYEDPEEVGELHRRCAHWFAANGAPERAVEHLTTVGAWEESAAVVTERLLLARLLLEGPGGRMARALRGIPTGAGSASSDLVRAALAVTNGRWAAAARELDALGAEPSSPAVTASATVVDALRCRHAGSADEALRSASRAEATVSALSDLGDLGDPDDAVGAGQLAALAAFCRGVALLRAGKLDRARTTLARAVGTDAVRPYRAFRAEVLGHLALAWALDGSLPRASRAAEEARALAGGVRAGASAGTMMAELVLAYVSLERYELAAARQHVTALRPAAGLLEDPLPRAVAEAVVAGLERATGHPAEALARLEAAARFTQPHDPWLADRLHSEGDPLRAALRSRPVSVPQQRRPEPARGTPGAPSRPETRPGTSAVDRVDRVDGSDGSDVVEPLTVKELEVLTNMEELLTNQEIAEKMFVSVNTVRTHVRNILRKLGVSRRSAAVRKARYLGLTDA